MAYKDSDAISVDVGNTLREMREARGLSIRALARQSGLSANALSMIERGRSSPSVSTLYKVADALEIPITDLFRSQSELGEIVYCKAASRTRVPFTRGVWEGLGGERFVGGVEPFALTLESGASSGPHAMIHSEHEFVLCLRGQLEYRVENETYLLEPGDSLLFSSQLKHRWRNPGPLVTDAIFVLSGFEEGEQTGGHRPIPTPAYDQAVD